MYHIARRYAPCKWQFDGGCFATSALVIVRKFSRKKDLRQSMDPKITVDLRPSVDGSAVCTSLVVGDG